MKLFFFSKQIRNARDKKTWATQAVPATLYEEVMAAPELTVSIKYVLFQLILTFFLLNVTKVKIHQNFQILFCKLLKSR